MAESRHSPLLRLLSYSARYRIMALKASIYSVLNKFFDVAPEILIGVAIDVVVRGDQSFVTQLGIESPKGQIIVIGVLTITIWVFESLFEYLYATEWQRLAQLVQHDLRMDAYRHVQKFEMEYFENKHSGQIVSILSDDINQLERFLNNGANAILQVASAVVFIGIVFFVISPDIAMVAITPIPLIVWGAARYKKIAEPLYAAVREKAGEISGRLTANLGGISTIKAFNAEDYESQYVQRLSRNYVDANQEAIRVSSAFTPIIRMAVLLGFVATLILGGFKAVNGEIAVGSFGILVFLTQRLLWPFTTLAHTVDLYQRAMASCERIMDLLNVPVMALSKREPLENVQGAIEFKNVSFAYPDRDLLLENFSLTIPKGQTVALVGSTGSGKSTIAKLLMGFYKPIAGIITLDGRDISDLSSFELRSAFGLVSQDVFLFADSVAANIAYALEQVDQEAVVNAAKKAAAHEFIEALPNKYETLVGERGQKLSGGQRQRIGLARAVIRNPPILILDEATSAVDNETERLIQESMERLRVGRTVLMIAHRLSTIKNADIIYVLEGGRIVESGTHSELIDKRGLYSQLYNGVD